MRVPLLNFERGPRPPGPGSRGPGFTFTPCLINESAKVTNVFNSYFETLTEALDSQISKINSFTLVTVDTMKIIVNVLPKNNSVSGDFPLNVLRSRSSH